MTKMTKMQKFEMLANIPAVAESPVLSEYVAREIALLEKKNTERKPTEKQTVNKAIQEAILETMRIDPERKFTITELMKVVPGLPEDMTNQRMSALVRPLIDVQVERIEEKRKAFFKIKSAE